MSIYIIVILVLLFITICLFLSDVQVSALSPPFPPQFARENTTFSSSDYSALKLKLLSNPNFRIDSVTYFSNGTTFQATFWLPQPICCLHRNLIRYGMEISVLPPYTYPDYDAYIQKDNHDRWTPHLIENERPAQGVPLSHPGNRTLNEANYTDFGSRSVTVSVNLGAIGYPTIYAVMFYTKYNDSIVDKTYVYTLPPHLNAHLKIGWSSPDNPYQMIAGENAVISVPINSTDLPPGHLHLTVKQNDTVFFTFDQKTLRFDLTNNTLGTIIKMRFYGTQNLDPGIHRMNVSKEYVDLSTNKTNPNLSSPAHFFIQIHRTPFDPVIIFLKYNGGFQVLAAPLIVIAIITIASVLGPELYKWIRRQVKGDNAAVRQIQKGYLTASDVLTVDGAVITGVLVLLSLTQKTTLNQLLGVSTLSIAQILGQSLFTTLTATIVYPFAVSAIIVAIENKPDTSPKFGIRIMAAGFVYLIVALFFIRFF